jgi:hypothetical protein
VTVTTAGPLVDVGDLDVFVGEVVGKVGAGGREVASTGVGAVKSDEILRMAA